MINADEDLAVLEGILDSEYLSQTQVVVFRQAWAGQSYVEIAIATGCDYCYIKALSISHTGHVHRFKKSDLD